MVHGGTTTEASEDDKLLAQVRHALRLEAEVSEARLDVFIESGRVRIEGEVPLYSRKISAIEAVAQVSGVKDIEDRISVKPEIRRSDAEIEDSVQRALISAAQVPDSSIVVSSKKGRVVLSGNVSALHLAHAAEHAAYTCEGVVFVENLILVDPATARSDVEIAKEAEESLAKEKGIDLSRIILTCISGRLVLRGTVDTLQQKIRVHKAVARTRGVVAINSQVEVR